ncbi:MAG: hypothetical protein KIT84_26470 [Labilithrix sp.]|nr:hypothetical protein [Labilithrix sp.]MCW5814598.1 hypothetical protein [Labilithrix sp.]
MSEPDEPSVPEPDEPIPDTEPAPILTAENNYSPGPGVTSSGTIVVLGGGHGDRGEVPQAIRDHQRRSTYYR